jgi:MFS family permease
MRNHPARRLIACLFLMSASIVSLRVTASLFVLQSGLGEWAVGLLLMTMSLAPLFLSLWAGHLTDRIGYRRPSQIAIALTCLGGLLPVFSTDLWVLAMACLVVGGGVSMNAVALQHVIGGLAKGDSDLKQLYGWVALAPAAAGATMGISTGVVIDLLGFGAAFLAAAVLPAIAYWLGSVNLTIQQSESREPTEASVLSAFRLFRNGPIRTVLLLNLVMAISWDAHSFVVPIVGHLRQLTATEIGLVLSSFSCATVLIRLVIIRWSRHLSESSVIQGAALTAGIGFIAYYWLPNTASLMAGSALIGLALGSVQPMMLSSLHQVTPESARGQALGLRMLMMHVGTVGMPMVFALLTRTFGATTPMVVMAGVLVVLALTKPLPSP